MKVGAPESPSRERVTAVFDLPRQASGGTQWSKAIPWFTTGMSVLIMIALAAFLLENVYWFRTVAMNQPARVDSAYTLYVFQLHNSLVKRSVGLFSGFALVFLGTSIAFYTLRDETQIEGRAGDIVAKLATASPGIVAMILGAGLIAFTIYSKDIFPSFDGPTVPEGHAPETVIQPQYPRGSR